MTDIFIGFLIGAGIILCLVGILAYIGIRWLRKQEEPIEIKWGKDGQA